MARPRRGRGGPPARRATTEPAQQPHPTDLPPVPEPRETRTLVEQRAFWQGPIPPPAILEQFGRIVPDAPERILRQWEGESEHRRSMERNTLESNHKRSVQGLWNAIVFALGALASANVALVLHEPQAAMVLGGGTIASVVAIFIYQRRPPTPAKNAADAKPKINLPARPR